MQFPTLLLPALLAAVTQAVNFNAFGETECNGFEETYHLNDNSKGNFPDGRESIRVLVAEAGCHMKLYTGLNQQPNDGSTISFTTETNGECYWNPNGQKYRSFGFYCP